MESLSIVSAQARAQFFEKLRLKEYRLLIFLPRFKLPSTVTLKVAHYPYFFIIVFKQFMLYLQLQEESSGSDLAQNDHRQS